MAGVKEELFAQLRNYDDDAYAALANRGLLRRAQKDLEKEAPVLQAETADILIVRASGFDISFDKRGPAHARCTCPASSVCQHILAAALMLQKLAQEAAPAPTAGTTPATAATPAIVQSDSVIQAAAPAAATPEGFASPAPAAQTSPMPDGGPASAIATLHDALLRFAPSELRTHAGKAGYAWAWQYVQDLAPEEDVEVRAEKNILISLRHPRIAFRYMGGGVGSLIADVEIKQIEKYRAAAVLAYQKANGITHPAPESRTARPATQALDLGRDHEVATGSDQTESRERLRQAVRQLTGECLQLGLSHLSPAIQERFSTLAVWAQGAEYYRLAMLLRRLADHVDLLLERAGAADEYRLFDELSLARALIEALAAHAANPAMQGRVPAHLIGQSRSTYEEIATLDLVALGALPWRSATGYLGLTMLFYSPKDRAFRSCTDARPESQRFDPIARYRNAGPWSGIGSPALMSGKAVRLLKPQVNRAGRLSLSAQTSATLGEVADWPASLPLPVERWADLADKYAHARRSLLAEARPLQDWFILKPARFGLREFDGVRQRLDWLLEDTDGVNLRASLTFSPYTEHAIGRIEQLVDADLPEGTLVVGRLAGTAADLTLEPLSLIYPAQNHRLDALHFDAGTKHGALSRWFGKLKGAAAAPTTRTPAGQAALVPSQMRDLRHWLRQQAERGVPVSGEAGTSTHAETEWRTQLSQQLDSCVQVGLTALAGPRPGTPAPAPEALLKANYLCMQYERLIVGVEEED